ncbi:MAG TPA: hypothetical protein OIM14_05280 [Oscillospiraceae bacterium]|nr:hypothetical protein [Oscillospiraceae bacterium]
MMNLDNFINEKKTDEVSARLIESLKKVPEYDKDLILAVLVYLKSDDEKNKMIEFIQNGKDVTYEQVTLNALWMSQQRAK